MAKEYALYKGEEHVAFGTLEELAEREGVKPSTIRFYSKPSYLKRIEERNIKDAVVTVCLDD